LSSGPSAGVLQPIVLQGQGAPGGLGTFGAIAGAFTPGLTFALGNHGELAFAGTVITSGGATLGGDFAVSSDGTVSKILVAGDAVPGTGGGPSRSRDCLSAAWEICLSSKPQLVAAALTR
jgi:hypothetical protein